MTETPADEPGEVDPGWWDAALDAADLAEYEASERLSIEFDRLAKNAEVDFQREVLTALAQVTSAMLKSGDWLDPFEPVMRFGDRRSPLPSDLTEEQVALLARVVPLVTRPDLRARVADVAWLYGDRSEVAMLDVAIDSYLAAPLEYQVWFRVGHVAWERAIELLKRRGPAGKARLEVAGETLKSRVLASTVDDRFFVPQLARFLFDNVSVDETATRAIAEHLTGLAADAGADARLSRHLEREAAAWFNRFDLALAVGCVDRVARTYLADADQRVAADADGSALAESLFLEKAIATFRDLPRKYRIEQGIETLITELRERLTASREAAREAMTRFQSDPIDLRGLIADARARVTGKAEPFESLAAFVRLFPAMDAEKTRAAAEELVDGSISHIFGSSTLGHDNRKVAASPGATPGENEAAVWSEMVRSVAMHSQVFSKGAILPALDVLLFEHRFTRELMINLCIESPTVPEGHAQLWGAGLALGMNRDFGPAVAIVVPQLEHVVRTLLKRRGAHTLFVDDDGVETEKSLNVLLDMTEATDIFGAGMVMEMKALLVEQGAANLRHDIAHGLLTDAAAWSFDSVYVWWFCLRLVIWPLIAMSTPHSDAPPGPPTAEQGDAPTAPGPDLPAN